MVTIIFTILVFYQRGSNAVFFLAGINACLMVFLWTGFATNIRARPASWLHPFRATDNALNRSRNARSPFAFYDLQMHQIA
jgi:hypothetical protein